MFPIREISAYNRKWKIKARVTSRSTVREFTTKAQGRQGKVFSADLLDAEGGEIRANFFNGAAERFDGMLEQGKVFTFANGNVKVANKRYSTIAHGYEITFDNAEADIAPADEDAAIENIKFNLVTVRGVQNKPVPSCVDLCAVVTSFTAAGSITTKLGETVRRTITVADQSGCSLDVTLFGKQSEVDEVKLNAKPCVILKGVNIRDYGGRSGTLANNGQMFFDSQLPNDQSLIKLRSWWESDGQSADFNALTVAGQGNNGPQTELVTIKQMKEQVDDSMIEPKYFDVISRLVQVRNTRGPDPEQIPIYYLACPNCRKKLQDHNCMNCNKEVDPSPRFLFTANFADCTDNHYFSLFEEAGQVCIGDPATHVKQITEKGQNMREYLNKKAFRDLFKMRVRAKPEMYNGETRLKYTGVRLQKVSAAEATGQLFKQIAALEGIAAC